MGEILCEDTFTHLRVLTTPYDALNAWFRISINAVSTKICSVRRR